MEFADASFDDNSVKYTLIFNLGNFFKKLRLFQSTFFSNLEILWEELMSDSSYIDHLLTSMLDRLAEVISNGGASIAY